MEPPFANVTFPATNGRADISFRSTQVFHSLTGYFSWLNENNIKGL
jgi:hypothetical protein